MIADLNAAQWACRREDWASTLQREGEVLARELGIIDWRTTEGAFTILNDSEKSLDAVAHVRLAVCALHCAGRHWAVPG